MSQALRDVFESCRFQRIYFSEFSSSSPCFFHFFAACSAKAERVQSSSSSFIVPRTILSASICTSVRHVFGPGFSIRELTNAAVYACMLRFAPLVCRKGPPLHLKKSFDIHLLFSTHASTLRFFAAGSSLAAAGAALAFKPLLFSAFCSRGKNCFFREANFPPARS